jgi:hypothetical protein
MGGDGVSFERGCSFICPRRLPDARVGWWLDHLGYFRRLSARGTVGLVRAGVGCCWVPLGGLGPLKSLAGGRRVRVTAAAVNYQPASMTCCGNGNGTRSDSTARVTFSKKPRYNDSAQHIAPPLGGPGPARSARARRILWRLWRHAAGKLRRRCERRWWRRRGWLLQAAPPPPEVRVAAAAPWRPSPPDPPPDPPPDSGINSAFSDLWPCGCREPSRGSQLLEGFRDLLVGPGRLLQNTEV